MQVLYSLGTTSNYEEVVEDVVETNQFKAIYANYDFSFQKSFYVYNEGGNVFYQVTNITPVQYPLFTEISIDSANTITISKTPNTILFPETYDFIKFNENFTESEIIEYDLDEYESQEDAELSMIGWNTPSPESFSNNYIFDFEYYNTNTSSTDTIQVNYEQEFYWDVNQSIPDFNSILDESRF